MLKKIGLAVPQTTETFKEYMITMNENEETMRQNLKTDKTPNAQHAVQLIAGVVGIRAAQLVSKVVVT